MTEPKLTKEISKILRIQGALIYPAMANEYSPLGWPDRWIGWKGLSWWIEFKASNTKVMPHQTTMMNNIISNGSKCWVIRLFNNKLLDIEKPDGIAVRFNIPWNKLLRTLKVMDTRF